MLKPVNSQNRCEVLSNETDPPNVQRFHTLVALMLSSQTKDEITAGAVRRLQAHGLTIDNVIATPEEQIASLIHPVGFWRRKAAYLKNTAIVRCALFYHVCEYFVHLNLADPSR